MRTHLPVVLTAAVLWACPSYQVNPPPSDAGSAPPVALDGPLYVIRGGTAFGHLSVVETESVTGLSARVASGTGLAVTLAGTDVQPGRPVLVRVDAALDAVPPLSGYGGYAPFSVELSGSRAGAPAQGAMEVYLLDEYPTNGFSVVVDPPTLDVTGGVAATGRVILSPRTVSLSGKARLKSIPGIRLTPSEVEFTSLAPIFVDLEVSPELRAEAGTRVRVDAWMGRTAASGGIFEVVTPPPPPLVVPTDLLVRPGSSVSLDVTQGNPALRAASWAFFDLPTGITGSVADGVATLSAAADAVPGARLLRIEGSGVGETKGVAVRLFVIRTGGDWPLLGDSATPEDKYAIDRLGMGVDQAGRVHVCPGGESLRVFEAGQWTNEGRPSSCVSGAIFTMDSTAGQVCLARYDEVLAKRVGGCWTGSPPAAWAEVSTKGRWFHLRGDVLAAIDDSAFVSYHRWTPAGLWSQLGAAQPATGLEDLASLPDGSLVAAGRVVVDKLTSSGWIKLQVPEVSRFDGTSWTKLDGLVGRLDFPAEDPNQEYLGVKAGMALELDAGGNPVVAWVDSGDEQIHLGRWDGTNWQQPASPLAPTPGRFVNAVYLKLDPAGAPVLAWLESGFPEELNVGLAYGTRRYPSRVRVHRLAGAAWEELSGEGLNLDLAGPVANIALALDTSGRPNVAWIEASRTFVARYTR